MNDSTAAWFCDIIGKKGSRCLTAEGGESFHLRAGPWRAAWTGRDTSGRRPSSGRSDQCHMQDPGGPSSGSVVGGALLIGWTPASASSLSCHILFSAWK